MDRPTRQILNQLRSDKASDKASDKGQRQASRPFAVMDRLGGFHPLGANNGPQSVRHEVKHQPRQRANAEDIVTFHSLETNSWHSGFPGVLEGRLCSSIRSSMM